MVHHGVELGWRSRSYSIALRVKQGETDACVHTFMHGVIEVSSLTVLDTEGQEFRGP